MTIYKVINGKRYDCRSAQLMAEYEYSNRRDFHWYHEELYRRKTGDFFLACEGGPASQYRRTINQNEWTGGEKIIPLTHDEAREWVERHCDGTTYDLIFPETLLDDEAPTKEAVSVRLTPAVMAELRKRAAAGGKSISETAERLLVQAMSGKA